MKNKKKAQMDALLDFSKTFYEKIFLFSLI